MRKNGCLGSVTAWGVDSEDRKRMACVGEAHTWRRVHHFIHMEVCTSLYTHEGVYITLYPGLGEACNQGLYIMFTVFISGPDHMQRGGKTQPLVENMHTLQCTTWIMGEVKSRMSSQAW